MSSQYSSTTEFLQATATEALSNASYNAARIWGLENVRADTRDPTVDITVNKPEMGPPPVFSDLFTGDTTDATVQYLDQQADDWLAKYFPAMHGCFKDQPEETLCGILSGVKPYGLDKSILDMVWNQARDRAGRTMRTEQATIAATFSGRGFSLPPGAMVDLIAQSEQRATDIALDVSREQAIKDADIKVDIYKMGLQLSVQLKTAVLSALADFYRMWITVPDKDIQRAQIRAQAQAALYAALSSYYNVEVAFEELRVKALMAGASTDIDVDRNTLTKQGNYMGIAGPLASAVSAFAGVAGNASQAGGSLTAQVESV